MHVIILHGHKLTRSGNLSQKMIERIDTLQNIIDKETAVLIITGGKTRKKFQSEAEVIHEYLKESNLDNFKNIILEKKSTTTIKNITNIRNIISDLTPQNITVITSSESVPRFTLLYKLLVPAMFPKTICIGTGKPTLIDTLTEVIKLFGTKFYIYSIK